MLLRAKYAQGGIGSSQPLEHVGQFSDVRWFHRPPHSPHPRASTWLRLGRPCRRLDAELPQLALKSLGGIERVQQRPILAQVGNQTATIEFDNEDRIPRSS
jgi:hypothetical protein